MQDDGRRESIPMTTSAPRRSVLARVNTRRPSTSPSRACVLAVAAALGVPGLAATRGVTAQTPAPGGQERGAEAAAPGESPGRKREDRRLFQGQELITA